MLFFIYTQVPRVNIVNRHYAPLVNIQLYIASEKINDHTFINNKNHRFDKLLPQFNVLIGNFKFFISQKNIKYFLS